MRYVDCPVKSNAATAIILISTVFRYVLSCAWMKRPRPILSHGYRRHRGKHIVELTAGLYRFRGGAVLCIIATYVASAHVIFIRSILVWQTLYFVFNNVFFVHLFWSGCVRAAVLPCVKRVVQTQAVQQLCVDKSVSYSSIFQLAAYM